jgi:collagenase-like PrtC family protease
VCYPGCVYKTFCDDLICTSSQKGDLTFNKLNEYRTTVACDLSNFSLYQKLANNVIYPSQMKHYEPYIDVIKISGRLNPIEQISQLFEAYVNEDNAYVLKQMYNGLIIPQEYYDFTLNCKNRCATCNVCDKIAEDYEQNKEDLV